MFIFTASASGLDWQPEHLLSPNYTSARIIKFEEYKTCWLCFWQYFLTKAFDNTPWLKFLTIFLTEVFDNTTWLKFLSILLSWSFFSMLLDWSFDNILGWRFLTILIRWSWCQYSLADVFDNILDRIKKCEHSRLCLNFMSLLCRSLKPYSWKVIEY